MGYMNALAMAGATDRHTALSWHLQANCYPPVHQAFLPVCEQAIDAALEDDWDREIEMPNGLVRTAAYIVDGLHLEAFLVEQDYDEMEVDENGNFIEEGDG